MGRTRAGEKGHLQDPVLPGGWSAAKGQAKMRRVDSILQDVLSLGVRQVTALDRGQWKNLVEAVVELQILVVPAK